MYPQGVCRIRKSASAGSGCAIFPTFDAEERAEKIHSSAAYDLFRDSLALFWLFVVGIARAIRTPIPRYRLLLLKTC